MNILVDNLPDVADIDGVLYPINTDFRCTITIILALSDMDLADVEKQQILLALLYRRDIPREHVLSAGKAAVRFIAGPSDVSDDSYTDSRKYYSFDRDSNLIYSAFMQTHGIDLQKANLHWWQFLALFSDLGADTAFCNLINLRKRVANGEATKEEHKAARRMGSAFDVDQPVHKTIEELEAERRFFDLVNKNKESKNGS